MIRVGIVDYEAKHIDKIPTWYEQQIEIMKCFEDDHGELKKCIWTISYKQKYNNKEDTITDSLCDKLVRFFTSVTHFFHKGDSPDIHRNAFNISQIRQTALSGRGEYTSITEKSPSTSLAPNNLYIKS